MKYKYFYSFLAFVFFSSSLRAENDIDVLKREICDLRPFLEGWCSQEKTLTLIDLTLELKPHVCVDIGVFGGASLIPVAATLKVLGSGIVIGIDPWDKFESIRCFDAFKESANFEWWLQLNHSYVYDSYIRTLNLLGLESFCKTLRTTSQKAAPAINQIDLLHIDGSHSEEGFTNDVKMFLPKVRASGYILLNDSLWENAQAAVDLLLEQCDVVKLIDNGNCIVFKKRK